MSNTNKLGEIPYEKANNVEYSLFQTKGRITRKAFFFRVIFCVLVWMIFHAIYLYWAKADFVFYTEMGGGKIQAGATQIEMRYNIIQILDFYLIPCLLAIFILIQATKRTHDVNRSGWFLLVPLYNLYLLFSEGTDDNNDFGLIPHPEKKSPKYRMNDDE
jgi:uncharacterized membrane protein YhaH (DUF805 family)